MHLELMREKAKEFPRVENAHRYTSLMVWHCNYRSFARLADFVNVRSLKVATWPDEHLKALTKLTKLQDLEILHLRKITSLRPLGCVKSLRKICLRVLPCWDYSGKRTMVDSFKPLATLPELRDLSLCNVIPADNDLRPLARCTKLRELCIDNVFSIDQFAWLNVRMPRLRKYLQPVFTLEDYLCDRCGTPKVSMVGVPKYNIKCPKCQHRRVQKHLDEWDASLKRAKRYVR